MAMELAGLKECLHEVLNKLKLRVAIFISDRHMQVRKYMCVKYREILQIPSYENKVHRHRVLSPNSVAQVAIIVSSVSFIGYCRQRLISTPTGNHAGAVKIS